MPGVWIDFVEHVIVDDGTGANAGKGCYQLWATVPPTSTSGYPSDGAFIDTRYSLYAGTYLWYNFNNITTTRNHTSYGYGHGMPDSKFGIYNGGPGWHNQTNSIYIGQASQAWMTTSLSSGGGGQPNTTPSTGGDPGQMEVYYGPIKIEYKTGTIQTGTVGPSGQTATSNYIDNTGYTNVQ